MARNGQNTARRTQISQSDICYSDEDVAFLAAIEDFKKAEGRPFPTWSETLEVLKSLGYRKVAEPMSVRALREIECDGSA